MTWMLAATALHHAASTGLAKVASMLLNETSNIDDEAILKIEFSCVFNKPLTRTVISSKLVGQFLYP